VFYTFNDQVVELGGANGPHIVDAVGYNQSVAIGNSDVELIFSDVEDSGKHLGIQRSV
jgi:hypothetical protein